MSISPYSTPLDKSSFSAFSRAAAPTSGVTLPITYGAQPSGGTSGGTSGVPERTLSPMPKPLAVDRFLDPAQNISSGQALGWFLGGFTLGLSGKAIWSQLYDKSRAFMSFKKQPFQPHLEFNTPSHLSAPPAPKTAKSPVSVAEKTSTPALVSDASSKTPASAPTIPKEPETLGTETPKDLGEVIEQAVAKALQKKADAKALAAKEAAANAPPPIDYSKGTQVYQNYNESLSTIYRVAQSAANMGSALLAYAGVTVLGFLAGTVSQGMQETWVRREETRIRAKLVNRMQSVVQESIRSKHQFDAQLKEETRQRIVALLQQQGLYNVDELVRDLPVIEPLGMQRRYFYEPTSRMVTPETSFSSLGISGGAFSGGFSGDVSGTISKNITGNVPGTGFGSVSGNMFAAPRPLNTPAKTPRRLFAGQLNNAPPANGAALDAETASPMDLSLLVKVQKGVLFGIGVFSGIALHGFCKLIGAKDNVAEDTPNLRVSESIQLRDLETWTLLGTKNKKNFAIMAGFFAMSAAAALGKTLVDGLREIEVTRINARTELDYQSHNWLTQDPTFHAIAERESVRTELMRLERDLPCLKLDRTMLRQRIQAILSNVGRNSAPPYYPMTPPVGLVVARA